MQCRIQSLLESLSQWLNHCYRKLIWVWEADSAMKLDCVWKHLEVNGDKASAVALEWWIWIFHPIWRLLVHTMLMMLLRIGMWFVNRRFDRTTVWTKSMNLSGVSTLAVVYKFRLPAVDIAKHHFEPFIGTGLHKHAHLHRQIYSHTCRLCHLTRSSQNMSSFTLTGT